MRSLLPRPPVWLRAPPAAAARRRRATPRWHPPSAPPRAAAPWAGARPAPAARRRWPSGWCGRAARPRAWDRWDRCGTWRRGSRAGGRGRARPRSVKRRPRARRPWWGAWIPLLTPLSVLSAPFDAPSREAHRLRRSTSAAPDALRRAAGADGAGSAPVRRDGRGARAAVGGVPVLRRRGDAGGRPLPALRGEGAPPETDDRGDPGKGPHGVRAPGARAALRAPGRPGADHGVPGPRRRARHLAGQPRRLADRHLLGDVLVLAGGHDRDVRRRPLPGDRDHGPRSRPAGAFRRLRLVRRPPGEGVDAALRRRPDHRLLKRAGFTRRRRGGSA